MVKPRFVGTPPTPTYIFEVPLWIGEENGSHRKFLSALQIFDCCTGRFGEAGIVGCGENALSGPRTPRLTLVSRYRRMRGMPSVSEKRVEAAANCVSLNRNVWSGSTLEMALLAEFALQEQAAARLGRQIRPQISRLFALREKTRQSSLCLVRERGSGALRCWTTRLQENRGVLSALCCFVGAASFPVVFCRFLL